MHDENNNYLTIMIKGLIKCIQFKNYHENENNYNNNKVYNYYSQALLLLLLLLLPLL